MDRPQVLILLVEDDDVVAVGLEAMLDDGGFSVRTVASAHDALDEEPRNIAGLVTDIRLGDGPDGWGVARHARELIPTIPVVYISGDSAQEHSARGVPNSIMLAKPFAPAQLLTAISALLNAVPPSTAA